MFTIKSIAIPTPCHQSWQQMEPNDQGRHCLQCSKTVVDFSKMTTDKIIDHLANTTNVCGRFGEFQLASINRRLDDKNSAGTNNWKKWLVAAGVLGTSFLNRVSAQTAPAKPAVTQQNPSAAPMMTLGKVAMTTGFTVNGHITAKDDGLPIPGVSIRIKGTNTGAVTDANGNFNLTAYSPNTVLVASFKGYETQEVSVTSVTDKPVAISLVLSTTFMGGIVIQRPFFSRVYYRFVKYPIKRLFGKHW